ncbi:MAG: hypothetical protein WDN01_03025 [Rhizomicrobium sp.]
MPLTPNDGDEAIDSIVDAGEGPGLEEMIAARPITAVLIATLLGFAIARIVF